MAPEGLTARERPGQAGEDHACRFLSDRGYAVRARNFRCRSGEIDVVAERDGIVVFVEVKERRGDGHGRGFESVTRGKRLRVIQAARRYASRFGLTEARLRFDVISIDWRDGKADVRHDEGAFDGSGS
ncbi:MAG: YraN family protein [Vicinamibacteria bacterium]